MVASSTNRIMTSQNNCAFASDILVKCPRFDNGLIPPFHAQTSLQAPRIFTGHTELNSLLTHSGSLTKALERRLQTKVLANIHRQKPHSLSTNWQHVLNTGGCAWQVRTTSLYPQTTHNQKDEEPLVFAQTLIPEAGLKRMPNATQAFASQPIGNVLFSQNQQPKRHWLFIGKVNLARLPKSLRQVCDIPNASLKYKSLWLRQSILVVKTKPFVITEIILPALINALHNWPLTEKTIDNKAAPSLKRRQNNARQAEVSSVSV